MPADFEKCITKYCENCGKELILKNNRDIHRKRFCSKSCLVAAIRPNQFVPPVSDETRQKMRKKHKITPEFLEAERNRGLNRRGKIRNSVLCKCLICSKVFYIPICRTDGRITKNGQVQNRKYCSNKCRQIASRKPDELKRNKTLLANWRKQILKRDNYSCVICGETETRFLQACHIKSREDYPELAYELDNGRTLCIYCHAEESPDKLKPLILGHVKIGKDIVFSTCEQCGEQYYRKPSQRGKYCSQECYHKSMRLDYVTG